MDKRNVKRKNLLYVGIAVSRPKYGEFGSCPIDKITAKQFNVDPATGRPMSDIDYIIHAQDAAQEMGLFMQLDEFKSSYLPSDVNVEETIKFAVPRYAQTPAELADLAVKFKSYQLKQLELKKRADDLEEYRKSFDEKPIVESKND